MKSADIVNVSKTEGILPLTPIFAGVLALGTLTRGAVAIAKAVKSAKEQLGEVKRRNRSMEAIALRKGLYTRPYKAGLGLFYIQQNQKTNERITAACPQEY